MEQRPNSDDFRRELDSIFQNASHKGRTHIDVRSRDLHREVGIFSQPNHVLPTCCSVMEQTMRQGDEILRAPPKGQEANLIIRYRLPRGDDLWQA